jgi:hypothetical protein
MIGFRKLLHRDAPEDSPVTEVDSASHSSDEIMEEYRSIMLDQLVRGGVAPSCVELEVRPSGKLRDGRFVFVGMMRLVHWERTSAVRLLLGLPILESRVRRMVRGSWLRDVSQFGGVWLHASGQLQDSGAMEDLRTIVVDIEKHEHESRPPVDSSVWSVPTDLGHLPDR